MDNWFLSTTIYCVEDFMEIRLSFYISCKCFSEIVGCMTKVYYVTVQIFTPLRNLRHIEISIILPLYSTERLQEILHQSCVVGTVVVGLVCLQTYGIRKIQISDICGAYWLVYFTCSPDCYSYNYRSEILLNKGYIYSTMAGPILSRKWMGSSVGYSSCWILSFANPWG